MELSKSVNKVLSEAYKLARRNEDEFFTPEHLLYCLLNNSDFESAFKKCNGDIEKLRKDLEEYVSNYVDKVQGIEPSESYSLNTIVLNAAKQAAFSEKDVIDIEHIISALYLLEESYATYYLEEQGISKGDLLYYLCHRDLDKNEDSDIKEDNKKEKNKGILKKYTTNLNDLVKEELIDPLIGREHIINRTIQILCRRTKNNPIHVGEPGVGKTAITYGLARMIVDGKVPKQLENAQIFSLDISSILAGTKYRGDFEERIQDIFNKIQELENPIVYIDEIHNIVGAGALNGGALDGAGLIKGYLLKEKIRFIGATTFDEYKKYFEKDKALSRRFGIVDIKETSVDETIKIINGLKGNFEDFHKVKYLDESIVSAVELSNKYINDKFLPDKAIDIIDEAGAYISINNEDESNRIITSNTIEEIISSICNIPKQTIESHEIDSLRELEGTLKKNVFGQEEAIKEVVKCIKLSRAGLKEENKPVAAMLFVGPTGVGKTEIAKTLSDVLNIDLIRFDMSEYTEKHAAAKLIGSPPGYVGYEEGGMLTDAIRKKPNSVLLLDEIEKAHTDILSVLLQVMDYATLTDNKGRKADFRNSIIIMTSNAGAREIGKALVGFGRREVNSSSIDSEVKKVFTPEFRNRLDKIIKFNHIDENMANKIVYHQLNKFKHKLMDKNIEIEFTDDLKRYIAKKGVSTEFGAREIIRIIDLELKSILVDEILFGKLRNGGKCTVDIIDGSLQII